MEFLDPEEKRQRSIRLFLGYSLLISIVVFLTFILSFVLQSFSLFTTSTEVRNGLLFIDSKPVSADITINGKQQKRTDARFVVPEGTYDVQLTANGYRDWQKTINVIGGSVTYHIYPRLFPTTIATKTTVPLPQPPKLWTQSPDRQWIIVGPKAALPTMQMIDTTKPNESPVDIQLPETVFNAQDMVNAQLDVIEWSSDNRHFLLQKSFADGSRQYVMINREKPEESYNLTTKLNLSPQGSVKLRDKKFDQYYILDASTKLLRKATLAAGIEPVILADGVIAYTPYGADIVLYATESGALTGTYAVRILDNTTNYLLQPIASTKDVLLDVARYDGDWMFVAGSGSQDETAIYVNPLQSSNNTDSTGALRSQLKLPLRAPRYASFSDNARFIALQNADSFTVYDAELQTIYSYKSPATLPKEGADWMDGFRLQTVSDSSVQVFEYDGSNYQILGNAANGYEPFYNPDYTTMFSVTQQSPPGGGVQVSSLTASQ